MPITATLNPSSITCKYVADNHIRKKYDENIDRLIEKSLSDQKRSNTNDLYSGNFSTIKSSFNLSDNASRLLRWSVESMILLSRPREVDVTKTKKIYNFKGAFITLTLPYDQFHDDVTIKSSFSLFLNSLRNTCGLKNYVWRMELQKNGNIHFHIIVDQYYRYQLLRYYWNKELKKLGYIDLYSGKFSKMSLSSYAKHRNLKVEECKDAYTKGVRSGWTSPPTVSVNSISSTKKLAGYLAKYMAKPSDDDAIEDEETKLRASKVGKLWARSYSLSSLPRMRNYDITNILEFIRNNKGLESIKLFKFDYCEIYYIRFTSITTKFYKAWRELFLSHAVHYNYCVP